MKMRRSGAWFTQQPAPDLPKRYNLRTKEVEASVKRFGSDEA
jgi:hypothetical protein